MTCPVCSTENETVAIHCKTCAWYFPLEGTPHYAFELSRAKQQYQMVSAFNQVYQHMQVQSKVLEKMSFRLDGLESVVSDLKENQGTMKVSDTSEVSDTYPDLEPIQRAEDFDTPEKRVAWWNDLEEQWQKAFNAGMLHRGEATDVPDDQRLQDIFSSAVLRLVGPRGMYPNITFELTNLSGVKHLTNLKFLIVTHNALTNLEGIEHLDNVIHLFVNANKLTSIKEVYYLPQLEQLYCNVNQLTTITPIRTLTNLDTFYCNFNQLTNLNGVTSKHSEKLKAFFCLPNDGLKPKEIKRIEKMDIFCKKG